MVAGLSVPILVVVMFLAIGANAQNVMLNPSFENGSGTFPDYWDDVYNAGDDTPIEYRSDGDTPHGVKYLRINNPDNFHATFGLVHVVRPDPDNYYLLPDSHYRITFLARTSDPITFPGVGVFGEEAHCWWEGAILRCVGTLLDYQLDNPSPITRPPGEWVEESIEFSTHPVTPPDTLYAFITLGFTEFPDPYNEYDNQYVDFDNVRLEYLGPRPTETPTPIVTSTPTPTPTPLPVFPVHVDLSAEPGSEGTGVYRIFGRENEHIGGRSETGDGLVAGDLNGDGVDDLVAVRYVGGVQYTKDRRVYVVFGSTDNAVVRGFEDTPPDFEVTGFKSYIFDACVCTGDVNGDGIDDLIVGDYEATPGGVVQKGAVYVYFGGPAMTGVIDRSLADVEITGATQYTGLGISVACADVNADGFSDIAIATKKGLIQIIKGGETLAGTIDLASVTPDFAMDYGHFLVTSSPLRFGDFDGDGLADLAVGFSSFTYSGRTECGAVFCFSGTTINGATEATLGDAVLTLYGADDYHRLGYDMATGDVNGDGYTDLFVSASTVVTEYRDDHYPCLLFHGGASFGGIRDLAAAAADVTLSWPGSLDWGWGHSISLCDLNADGLDDALIGCPKANYGQALAVGWTGVLFSPFSSQALGASSFGSLITGSQSIEGGLFGYASGPAFDFNDDGLADIAISEIIADAPSPIGTVNTGMVAVITGVEGQNYTSVSRFIVGGDAPSMDFGPIARCTVDHLSGDSGSKDTVTVFREAPDGGWDSVLDGVPLPVHWKYETDRDSFEAWIRVRYTDVQCGNVDESKLTVYTSVDGQPGSWVNRDQSAVIFEDQNEVLVPGVSGDLYIAILDWTNRSTRAGGWESYR